jgi:DNA-binding NtrC family response regulator
VGGTHKVKVDLSIIAATNQNLEELIRQGRFREDLYYRLKVVSLSVPPLRDRKEDIPALIEAFIAEFNQRHEGKIRGISPQALKRLMEHSWPGNVRELKHAIESAAILASGETIGVEGFGQLQASRGVVEGPTSSGPLLSFPVGTPLEQVERALIAATLAEYGTRQRTARALGIGLRTLYSKLRRYALS